MSTNNNSGFGGNTGATKAWDRMGNPDTQGDDTGTTDDDKKMGTDPQPKAGSGDPKKA